MKKTVALSALLALSSSLVQAAPTIGVSISRSFFMSSPKNAVYLGGSTSVGINDGSFVITDLRSRRLAILNGNNYL